MLLLPYLDLMPKKEREKESSAAGLATGLTTTLGTTETLGLGFPPPNKRPRVGPRA